MGKKESKDATPTAAASSDNQTPASSSTDPNAAPTVGAVLTGMKDLFGGFQTMMATMLDRQQTAHREIQEQQERYRVEVMNRLDRQQAMHLNLQERFRAELQAAVQTTVLQGIQAAQAVAQGDPLNAQPPAPEMTQVSQQLGEAAVEHTQALTGPAGPSLQQGYP